MKRKWTTAGLMGLALAGIFAVSIAQDAGPTIEDLVKSATQRADAMREQLGDISGSTDRKVQAYQQQAQSLAQGNRDRIRQGLSYLGQGYTEESLDPIVQNKNGVVYVAVSLSMPTASLRQLVRDAEKAGVQVVIQGPVKGSFKETITRLRSVFSEGEIAGIAIDPRVFEQYKIERVPAFIAAPEEVQGCEQGLDCDRGDVPHDILRGNVTLAYALKAISDQGDAAPLAAREALGRLEN
jgi:conjugal transfer pilus assembly protein TrbC